MSATTVTEKIQEILEEYYPDGLTEADMEDINVIALDKNYEWGIKPAGERPPESRD